MYKLSSTKKLLLFSFFLLLPTQLGYHFWPDWSLVRGIRVDYLSPTIYLTDILLAVLLLLDAKVIYLSLKKDLQKKLMFFVVLLLFVFLNIISSHSLFLTGYRWLKIIEFALLGYFCVIHNLEAKLIFFKAIILVIFYLFVIAIWQFVKGGSINGLFYWIGERKFTVNTPGIALGKIGNVVYLRPYATLPHPNALAGFVAVSYFLVIKDLYKNRNLKFFVSLMVFIIILLTESFAIWISVTIIILWYFLSLNKLKFSNLAKKTALLTAYYVSLLSPILFNLFHLNLQSKSFNERIALSVAAGKAIANNPFVGTGLGNFVYNLPNYLYGKILLLQPVHNVPLLLFAEVGAIGSIIFLFLLFFVPISPAFFIVIITSLFDHYWITLQQTSLLLAILVGVGYNWGSDK